MAQRIINDGQPVYSIEDAPPGSIEQVCQHCALAYATAPCLGGRKFCSWECRQESRRTGRTVFPCVCLWCGVTHHKPKYLADKAVYCSPACRGAHQRATGSRATGRVEVHCQQCNASMIVPKCRSVDPGRAKYCSRTCATLGRPFYKSSAIGNAAIALVMSRQSEILDSEFRIGRWSIDLAAPLRMLAIELDGEYWHSLPRMVARDVRKDADLLSRGWTVKRIVIVKADTPETLADKIVKALR